MTYDGKNKFGWKKGDASFKLSQCSDCQRNLAANECEIYGVPKPDMFLMNEEECAYKVIEKK